MITNSVKVLKAIEVYILFIYILLLFSSKISFNTFMVAVYESFLKHFLLTYFWLCWAAAWGLVSSCGCGASLIMEHVGSR